jgi:hypothetical protein
MRKNQTVIINESQYTVKGEQKEWYLDHPFNSNDQIFKNLGIGDKYHFVSSIVGYKVDRGVFPEVKTLGDIEKVVKALQEYKDELTFTLEDYRKYIGKACSEWKERIFEECGEELLETGSASLTEDTIMEMIDEATSEQLEVLGKVFPQYMNDKKVKTEDMEHGSVMQTSSGILILFTGGYWVELNNDLEVYEYDPELVGKIVDIEIKVK